MQHLTSLKELKIVECKELNLFSEKSDDGTQFVTTQQMLDISNVSRSITLPEWTTTSYHFRGLKLKDVPI